MVLCQTNKQTLEYNYMFIWSSPRTRNIPIYRELGNQLPTLAVHNWQRTAIIRCLQLAKELSLLAVCKTRLRSYAIGIQKAKTNALTQLQLLGAFWQSSDTSLERIYTLPDVFLTWRQFDRVYLSMKSLSFIISL